MCLSKNWSYNLQSNTHTSRGNNEEEEEKNLIEDKWYIHPRKLQAQEIIFLAHVSVGSHLSIKRTTEQVLESGYRWENMDSDISEMISRCEICGTRGSKPRKNIATKHIESHRAKERYQADIVFLSDYLVGNEGQRYLLTIVDHFSKFGYATLMHTKTGIEVLASFKEFLKLIGKPDILQTDNGGEFNNEEMKVFLKNQKIEYIRGSPYHPQSQGAVEGFNRTIQNFLYLSKDMNLDEFNLNNSVYDFCMYYNNRIHSTTRFKPQEVIEKRWDEEFTLSVYNNIVDARRKSKIDKLIEGQIVRISNYLKISRDWKYVMYYKAKILAKNIKKEIFQMKGKIIKEKRNSCKLIVTTSEMNNILLIKGGKYYVDKRALK